MRKNVQDKKKAKLMFILLKNIKKFIFFVNYLVYYKKINLMLSYFWLTI